MNLDIPFRWQQLNCPVCQGTGSIGVGEHHEERIKEHPSNCTELVQSWYDSYSACTECGGNGKKWAYAPAPVIREDGYY